MIVLEIIALALVYISLLVIMGSTLVSIMTDDVSFTDESKFSWDIAAFRRVAIKGAIFCVSFVVYFLMIYNFKFLGE